MQTLQSFETQKEMRRKRNQRYRNRKAELHFERTKSEPIRGEWRGKFIGTLTWHDRLTGTILSFDFHLSQKRINSFCVTVNAQPWKNQIGFSRVLAALRKKLPRFRLHT